MKIYDFIEQIQQKTPSAFPATGVNLLYFKTDGYLYMLDENGRETLLGGNGLITQLIIQMGEIKKMLASLIKTQYLIGEVVDADLINYMNLNC